MKITRGKVKSVKVYTSLLGKDVICVGDTKYNLRDGEVDIRCINKEESRSVLMLLFIILLACTIIGLFAVPFLMVSGKRQAVTIQIDSPQEKGIIAIADKGEWAILSKYSVLAK